MNEILEVVVDSQKGRVDKVLTAEFTQFSRSQIQNWVKNGHVFANGDAVPANYKVKSGDVIRIERPEIVELELIAQDIPLDIVYEDNDVMVINKPQGMVVHPSKSHPDGTLVNALLFHSKDLSGINDVIRPGIVHRIDKDTSGLLMVAKNDETHRALQEQLMDKTVIRKYVALVHGEIQHETGTIDAPIGRSHSNRLVNTVRPEGKKAITHFTVLERYQGYTLVECQLETGRTHQIRVHMKYIDYPIAGDPVYGPSGTLKGNGQFLHAATLGFVHPKTGEELLFEAPLPAIFQDTLNGLLKK
ncbi:RluA family pseudouridine synthase [Vagococcus xieshaowenii]|uniref:Pseudouridine synthase n=1 Tax=Vagococcus xieshaowenii TaxID=2562451 RepID=A0AAJ5EFS7_9ENTE|nr:RluA family pseudouridine synthase [Vagococcus xieshaowenii]QCA28587.1 RluA family pseudouridine synthase [Vagococcus xieshaowenii]TFZ40605.1 RluA family pseudouridine synthase [Vagococcus xieshaowenii]